MLNVGNKTTTYCTYNPPHSLLEVEGEISGNYANFKQMLHRLKLTLLKVLEDIQILWTVEEEWC